MVNELMRRRALMFEKVGGGVPSGYTQYDWVQSVENTAVDTQYLCEYPLNTKQHRYRFEGKYARSATAGAWPYKYIFAAIGNNYGIMLRGDGDNLNPIYQGAYTTSNVIADVAVQGVWHSFVMTHSTTVGALGGLFDVDGNEYTAGGRDGYATTGNLIIFGNGTNNTSYPCRFAELKVYEYDVLVADLVPCSRDADGAVGFYDIVRNMFLTTTGSAVLTCGNGFNNF